MRTKGSWRRAATWNFPSSASAHHLIGSAGLFKAALQQMVDDHADTSGSHPASARFVSPAAGARIALRLPRSSIKVAIRSGCRAKSSLVCRTHLGIDEPGASINFAQVPRRRLPVSTAARCW